MFVFNFHLNAIRFEFEKKELCISFSKVRRKNFVIRNTVRVFIFDFMFCFNYKLASREKAAGE